MRAVCGVFPKGSAIKEEIKQGSKRKRKGQTSKDSVGEGKGDHEKVGDRIVVEPGGQDGEEEERHVNETSDDTSAHDDLGQREEA